MEQLEAVRAAFAQRGYDGDLRVARVTSGDERIFVVPRAGLDGAGLEQELQAILGRKIWVVEPSPEWSDTEPFR